MTQNHPLEFLKTRKNKVRFLERRMFENYLLVPIAIDRLFNEIGREFNIVSTPDAVNGWFEDHGGEHCDQPQSAPPTFSMDWLKCVNGAALLEALFDDLSENRLSFRKTVHVPRLTLLVHQLDPNSTTEIVDLVADVIE